LERICLCYADTMLILAISSGPRGQNRSYYCFWNGVFSWTLVEILPSDGVIFYTDGSLCEGRVGAGVFSDTLDIRESYALGSLTTVFQTEVHAILACSDYCQSVNMQTWRFVYVLIARLRCWLYPHIQFRLNFYTSTGYHCKISLITTGWDCFRCQVTATLRAMRKLIGWCGWARTPTFVDRSLVFHCQLQLSGIWIEGRSLTHTLNTGLHLTAVDNLSFGLNTQSCKQPNTSWVCLKNSSEFWFLLSRGYCCLIKHLQGWDWHQALFVHLANW
jgi:hypothetical protein